MQACGGRSHRAAYARVDGLVVGGVAIFGVALQVRGDGDSAHALEQGGEVQVGRLPAQAHAHQPGGGGGGELLGIEVHSRAFEAHLPFVPALEVAHQAHPLALSTALETAHVLGRLGGVEQEYLHAAAGGLAHEQARRNHTRVVAHQQRPGLEQAGELAEASVLRRGVVSGGCHEQAAGVALFKRVPGDALRRQRIVEGLYAYILRTHQKPRYVSGRKAWSSAFTLSLTSNESMNALMVASVMSLLVRVRAFRAS